MSLLCVCKYRQTVSLPLSPVRIFVYLHVTVLGATLSIIYHSCFASNCEAGHGIVCQYCDHTLCDMVVDYKPTLIDLSECTLFSSFVCLSVYLFVTSLQYQ